MKITGYMLVAACLVSGILAGGYVAPPPAPIADAKGASGLAAKAGPNPVTVGLPAPAPEKGHSDQGTPIVGAGDSPAKGKGGKSKGETYEGFKAKYDALTPEEKEKIQESLFNGLKGCGELRCKLRKYIAELLKNKDAPLKPADVAAKLKKYSEACQKKGKDGKAPEKKPDTPPTPTPTPPTPPALPTPYLAPPAVPEAAHAPQNLPAPTSDGKGNDAKAIVA